MKLITPHGGVLVNREAKGDERKRLGRAARRMPKLRLSPRQVSDLLLIATGAYSPIEGFLGEADYQSVCSRMRLAISVVIPVYNVLSAQRTI